MARMRARRRRRGSELKSRRGPDRGALVRFSAFAVLTGLLTFFIGQQIMGTSFGDRYRLTATFDDVTGLLDGDLVKVAGAPVGRVGEIRVERGRAVVVMDIDKAVHIPDDSTAAVRWRNMVGQRMIYLLPGSSRAMLPPGGKVPHTRSVVDLSEIVNSLGPLTRSLDPNQINLILNAFATTLEGNTGNINSMISNIDGLLRTFAERKRTIQQMTRDYKTVSDAIARRDQQIAQSVDNLTELTEVFAQNSKLLDSAVVEISGVTTNLNQVLGGNEAQLGRLVENLTSFSETARINIDRLEKMVQQLPLTMRQLFAAMNGGHFMRTNALCLNIQQGPCPFPMRFPSSQGGSGTSASPQDLAKLEAMLRGGR